MNENWEQMTPTERLQFMAKARENPCPDGEHEYADRVDRMGDATMLNQMCVKCFDIQGWIYNWETRG
jgi:hypothetical protein